MAALAEMVADLTGGKPTEKNVPAEIPQLRNDYMAGIEKFQSDDTTLRPKRFVAELSEVMLADGIIIADPGTPTPYLTA